MTIRHWRTSHHYRHSCRVILFFIIQKEQAERELGWEREQQEKREALEAAQRELEEVLNTKGAEVVLFHGKMLKSIPLTLSVSIQV